METNLRKLLNEAQHQINTYKHPDIDDFQAAMSEVLEAAGIGSLKHDCIEGISEYNGRIEIETSWSARGCAQTSTYSIPSAVIDSENPLREAKLYGVTKRLSEARAELSKYQSYVNAYSAKVAELQAELTTI